MAAAADPEEGEAPRKAFPLRLRWREQYPLRCDSLEQPSLEQSRLHCFPLNFLRMPLGVETTSPFLYLCGVPGGRDRGEDGVDLGAHVCRIRLLNMY